MNLTNVLDLTPGELALVRFCGGLGLMRLIQLLVLVSAIISRGLLTVNTDTTGSGANH